MKPQFPFVANSSKAAPFNVLLRAVQSKLFNIDR
jgi:hypothetical protein